MNADDIIEALPSLSKADLQRVAMFARELVGSTKADTACLELWDAYVRVGEERGLGIPSMLNFTHRSEFGAYKSAAQNVADNVIPRFRPKDETERKFAYATIARCLFKYIVQVVKTTPMAGLLLRQTPNVMSAIDHSFPGYAANDRLHWTIPR